MRGKLCDQAAIWLPFLVCVFALGGTTPPAVAQVAFVDVAPQLGLDEVGSCAALFWYDYDNDGDLDLLQPRRFSGTTIMFRNDGNHFTRMTNIGLPTGRDAGLAVPMDIDHDGDFDLFFAEYHTTCQLLIDENGVFVDRTATMGLPAVTGGRDYKWVDFDRDGWMDLLFGDTGGFHLYHNVEGAHFEEITEQAQLPTLTTFHRTCEADIDLDGDIDLFVTSIESGDRLYINLGGGVFADSTAVSGLSSAVGRGGCAWVDINKDKYPDLLTQGVGKHAIWLNNQDGTFSLANVHGTETDWELDWPYACDYAVADFNMDGLYDFYCCRPGSCGDHMAPNQFFIQDSLVNNDIYFHDVAPALGMNQTADGYPTVADYDHDGDMDLFMTVHNGANRLYQNVSTRTLSDFQVRVLGTNSEEDKWHTRVVVFLHGTDQIVASSELNTSNVARNGFRNYFVLDENAHYDLRIYSNAGSMEPEVYPQLFDVVPAQINRQMTVLWGQAAGGVENGSTPVGFFRLDAAYPNPFNALTKVCFSVPVNADVRLSVFDLLGRHVTDLTTGMQSAGEHTVTWDASTVASGVYLIQLQSGKSMARQKVVLLK